MDVNPPREEEALCLVKENEDGAERRLPEDCSFVLVRSSSQCSVIGASVAILARRSKQANLHDSSMQTNAARSRRNPPGRYKVRNDRTKLSSDPIPFQNELFRGRIH